MPESATVGSAEQDREGDASSPLVGLVASPVAVAMLGGAAVAIGVLLLAVLVRELTVDPALSGFHDFLAFFSAGKLVLEGRGSDLYDAAALTAIQRAIISHPVGANGYMPFINPPFAAVAFAPLAALPEAVARDVWAIVSLALACVAAAWIASPLRGLARVVGFALVLSTYPVFHAVAEGQWSFVLLLGGLASLEFARRREWGRSGAALGLFWIKPQLALLPLVGLALDRRWRAVVAAVAVGAVLSVAAVAVTGLAVHVQYVTYLTDVALSHFSGAGVAQPVVWRGDLRTAEGLNGLLVGVLGQGSIGGVDALWLVGAILLVLLYALAARRQRPGFDTLDARALLAAGIALVLLVNPNLFAQDTLLVWLVPAALWPLPEGAALLVIAAIAGISDLVFLDLAVEPWHVFTVVLLIGCVGVCLRAVHTGPGRSAVERSAG